uniref:Alpha-galactosidase 3-like isoform X2 n=1 Tax=Tanacetum cinerariifolium TaxID=118510 RepID=A0A699HDL9_TANCI|nr:alpha-galactosidase 3-like isoform X2 [Tanacetum cinerariifolium]
MIFFSRSRTFGHFRSQWQQNIHLEVPFNIGHLHFKFRGIELDAHRVFSALDIEQWINWPLIRPEISYTIYQRFPTIRDALNSIGQKIFFSFVTSVADLNDIWSAYVSPGGWNDPDMLTVSNEVMTYREYKSHFNIWPLMKKYKKNSYAKAKSLEPPVAPIVEPVVSYQQNPPQIPSP